MNHIALQVVHNQQVIYWIGDLIVKKIAVVTATRTEHGLLAPVLKELRKHEDDLRIELIVTGAHLSGDQRIWHDRPENRRR